MSWLPCKLVVVPVDFSGFSVDSIRTALEFVEKPDQLHVVHAVPHLDYMSPGMEWGAIDDESREQSVRAHFDEFLDEHGIHGVTSVVLSGDPGTEIAEYAEQSDADLIAIPSHGYHGFKRFVLGSVAERVVRHAHCPVLILRRQDAE